MQRKKYSFLFLLWIPILIEAQELLWSVQSGGPGFDLARAVAVDSENSIYTAGNFTGRVVFGANEFAFEDNGVLSRGYLQKVSSTGKVEKVFVTEGQGSAECHNIAIDAFDYIYVTGVFAGTIDFDPDPDSTFSLTSLAAYTLFVAKFDRDLALVRAFAVAASDGYVEASIAVDDFSSIYLGGVFDGMVDMDPSDSESTLVARGSSDAFLAKYDAAGALLWAKSMGSARNDALLDLSYDPITNTLVSTGYFREEIDTTSFGEIVNMVSKGSWDVFIQKTDLEGQIIWTRTFGGAAWDTGYAIAVDDQGNIYTVGTFFETADFDPGEGVFEIQPLSEDLSGQTSNDDGFLQRLDANGHFVWARALRSVGTSIVNDVSISPEQEVLVTGVFTHVLEFPDQEEVTLQIPANTSHFFTSFVAKYEKGGAVLQVFSLAGCNTAIDQSISSDRNNSMIVAGIFDETVDLDPSIDTMLLESRGSSDSYTVKFSDELTSIYEKPTLQPFTVFPNPTQQGVYIQGLADQQAYQVKVYDPVGVLLSIQNVAKSALVDLKNFPGGLYILVITTPQHTYMTRCLKQ